MYVCGPTVSGESHLGHARPYITFDVLYRYLLHLGYKVRYVRNITDAGHFEEEGREAEDKIATKAVLEKLEPMELVHKYTSLFHWAMDQFNTLQPSIEPTATGHIVEQIGMIEQLIEAGYAYVVNGSVYFDVKKCSWGVGYPGWHIECSAMATKYLGAQFDIHGGGMDLQFPHHESEIAQSTICNHQSPVKYWMHNNMITINGRKMGKSYNNVIRLTELFSGNHPILEKAYSPMTVRFFILQTQYRSTLDFSNEALQAAERGWKRLWESHGWLQQYTSTNKAEGKDQELEQKVIQLVAELDEFINDDLNTAKVLANLFELVPVINGIKDKHIVADALSDATIVLLKTQMKLYLEDILGLKAETAADHKQLDGVMQLLMDLRKDAKKK